MINSTIDKKISDMIARRSLTALFTAQGKKRPTKPYCEVSLLDLKDVSGMNAKERTKLFTCRFRVLASDDTAITKTNSIVSALSTPAERALLFPLIYVATISGVIPLNEETESKYTYSAFVDINFSYEEAAAVETTVARISGELFDKNIDIVLEQLPPEE
ncbi:MAG TPA: hypothetical protein PLZ43_13800 [bacterium]|nr:hypothetical protein [bacterium]